MTNLIVDETLNEPRLKPCPFCNKVKLLVLKEKGKDIYRPICECGWAYKVVHQWIDDKDELISYYNDFIQTLGYGGK